MRPPWAAAFLGFLALSAWANPPTGRFTPTLRVPDPSAVESQVREALGDPELQIPFVPLDIEDRLRIQLAQMTAEILREAELRQLPPPRAFVRMWRAGPGTFVLEVGGGESLGIRPSFVAVGGGAGTAYAGILRMGEVAYFQGFVDITDGMRFYGLHDFDVVRLTLNPSLLMVLVFREGIRATVHELTGVVGTLEPQGGLALEVPTLRIDGVEIESIRVGVFGGNSFRIDTTGSSLTPFAAGYFISAGADLRR
jgi:hypothetical protein